MKQQHDADMQIVESLSELSGLTEHGPVRIGTVGGVGAVLVGAQLFASFVYVAAVCSNWP